ncbi:MAG: hypothetical protein WCJ02_09090 [bacterium]
MSRKEQLQNEHQGRVDRMRLDSPLPSTCTPQRRSMRGIIVIVFFVILLIAAVAWVMYGGK